MNTSELRSSMRLQRGLSLDIRPAGDSTPHPLLSGSRASESDDNSQFQIESKDQNIQSSISNDVYSFSECEEFESGY